MSKVKFVLFVWAIFLTTLFPRMVQADTNPLAGGFCKYFELSAFNYIGNFEQPIQMPMAEVRVTQSYHTSYSEGWCDSGGQSDVYSPTCKGQKINYGHDGLDLHPRFAKAGEKDVFSIQPGLVVASSWRYYSKGWGDFIIIATRANPYSEEIITLHYHHLHSSGKSQQEYTTTRLVNPCDTVYRGQILAKEGGTTNWPTHLHLSFKRWRNLRELTDKINSDPHGFLGVGYTFGNDSLLTNFLDPQGYIYDYFHEFNAYRDSYLDWQWAQPYALFMRSHGWEFGQFDGSFGLTSLVKRREISRWLKTALELKNTNSYLVTFLDIQNDDPDFVYVDTLVNQNVPIKIINPKHSCPGTLQYFCPDGLINRGEAIKMIIAGFYQQDFLKVYNNWVWKASVPVAGALLSKFTDVAPSDWFAPYVYYGSLVGIISPSVNFRPSEPIKRAELAKWLVQAYQSRHSGAFSFCSTLYCPTGTYCDDLQKNCQPIPTCLPTEDEFCPIGGGNIGGEIADTGVLYDTGSVADSGVLDSTVIPTYDTGSITDSGFVYDSGTATDSGIDVWDSIVVDSTIGHPDSGVDTSLPIPTCACTSGVCCDGCNYLPTSKSCSTITEYHCAGASPGDNAEYRTRIQSCSGYSNDCAGKELINTWQVYQDCTISQTCSHPTSSAPICIDIPPPACTDHYISSPTGSSCYSNPAGSGSPTICLETNQLSGASWQYRFCKQGSAFSKDIAYQLRDQNHSSHFLSSGSLLSGASCSAWATINFSYLPDYGPTYGAGLQVEILSPSTCATSSCTYYSGITTVYRKCL